MSGIYRTRLIGTSGEAVDVNEDGQLEVVRAGEVDANNSNTTNRGSGGVFTGIATDILDTSVIVVTVYSDVASATDGLEVQWSPDGNNWDGSDCFTIPAGVQKTFTFQPVTQYYRIIYTNGANPQTAFRLHSQLKPSYVKPSSHRIQDAIIDDDDAELVKAVLTGKNPGDEFINFEATNAGNFKVSLEEFESQVSTNSNTQLKTTIYDEGGIPASVDDSTETLQTIDYAHHEIHSGSNYRVQVFDDSIGNNGELSISFFVPDQTKLPHMIWEFVHQGDMTMVLLEGTTLTTGTGADVLCKNSRRDAGDTSILQGVATGSLTSHYVTKNATYSGGTTVSLKRNYAAKNVAASSGRRAEVILAANTYYTFVLSNNETTTQGGQIRLEWYEHVDAN